MIPAILIGRDGSKGFPGKNTYKILGKSLMVYPLEAALNSKYIDSIYVSTDSKKIKDIAYNYNCIVIDRPKELCTEDARCEYVFKHAYEYIKKNNDIEMIVLLMCNAPMITEDTIDKGIEILRKNPNIDSAITVSRYNMYSPLRARKINKNGLLEPFVRHDLIGDIKKLDSDRNSQGDCWFADMGTSIIRPRCLDNINDGLLPQKWMGKKIYPLKQEGGFDIDYEWEIPNVEYWLRKYDRN
jgi:CMP-N-acetylneuraminic acid synthetase